MRSSSTGRSSSINPVRISMLDREGNGAARSEVRRTQTLNPKTSVSSAEGSHIPRARTRTSSLVSTTTGKTPLHQNACLTPNTPMESAKKYRLPSGDRRSPSAERASVIGTKASRKDTRPLNDKAYQASMLNTIDQFFHEIDQKSMLNSNGSLKPITLKMFIEVSGFLVKLLDIKQTFTTANYIEELPKVAKKLHYPGIMNKAWLKTANAMHSWPNVLGWLSWLVEVCKVKDIAIETFPLENVPFVGSEIQAPINRSIFFTMLDCYKAWNDEKPEEEAALLDKCLLGFETEQGITTETLSKAQSELEQEEKRLQEVELESEEIDKKVESLEKILSSLKQTHADQLVSLKNAEDHIKRTIKETEELNVECNALSDHIEVQTAKRNDLILTIKNQPLSMTEKKKIVEECTEIQNYIHQFNEHLQDIRKEIYSLDIKLASSNNNLNKTVLAYNKEIFMLLCDDINVDLELLKMPETGLRDADIMNVLTTKAKLMNDLKESLKQQLAERTRSVELDSKELENLEEELKMQQRNNEFICEKIEERKVCMNKIKAEMDVKEANLRTQILKLQNQYKEIEQSIPKTVLITEEVDKLKDALATVQERKIFIEESAEMFFTKFYEILNEHRTELAGILRRNQDSTE